jgi:serine/threonine protein kinase
MERCAGDLQKFIENKLRVLKKVIASQTILVQLSVGLSYLHEKGIVHRDLKPQNILLSEISSEVFLFKLADFGLSKQQHFTPTGTTAFSQTAPSGTSGYMAPEILEANGNMEPNFKSDIWALGVIFFYVLSDGQHPFGGRTPIVRDVIIKMMKKLRNIGPISHDWAATDLVLQLLQYDPEKRPSSLLIILHPYFSLHNQTTKLFLAKQLFDLYENKKDFSLRLEDEQLKEWYKSREEASGEDEKNLKDLEIILTTLVTTIILLPLGLDHASLPKKSAARSKNKNSNKP